MKYFVGVMMKGNFPGSPDKDYFEVTEEKYDLVRSILMDTHQVKPMLRPEDW